MSNACSEQLIRYFVRSCWSLDILWHLAEADLCNEEEWLGGAVLDHCPLGISVQTSVQPNHDHVKQRQVCKCSQISLCCY